FTLKAGSKTANLLSELILQTQLRSSDGGFIYVSSTQPLYGIELFFLRNLRIIANVAAGIVFSGIKIMPPPSLAPLVVTSMSPTRAAVGATLTFTGSGFSPSAGSNTVVFTGSSGAVAVPADTATSTMLTVTIPLTATTGPVFVQRSRQVSSSQILEVLATSSSLLPASPFTVDSASLV